MILRLCLFSQTGTGARRLGLIKPSPPWQCKAAAACRQRLPRQEVTPLLWKMWVAIVVVVKRAGWAEVNWAGRGVDRSRGRRRGGRLPHHHKLINNFFLISHEANSPAVLDKVRYTSFAIVYAAFIMADPPLLYSFGPPDLHNAFIPLYLSDLVPCNGTPHQASSLFL